MTPETLRSRAVPILASAGAILIAIILGYFTATPSRGGSSFTPEARGDIPFQGIVSGLNGDQLTVATANGNVTVRLVTNLPVETLRPATISQLRPGDWINGGANTHTQTMFALRNLVIIPAAQVKAPQ